VLQAAHILPVSRGGAHRTDNGLLLRSDTHTLFDLGYGTVTPDHKFLVSQSLKEEYSNGRVYYELHGREIRMPVRLEDRPSREYLEWHAEMVYRR
jgi:putative restriction endonuclease